MSDPGPHFFLGRRQDRSPRVLLGQKLERPASRLVEDDPVPEDDSAVDDRQHDAGVERHALERRPTTLIVERLRRYVVRSVEIYDHEIGTVTLAQEPPVHNAKEARGIMRGFGNDLIQREYASVVLLQKHLKGMLDQR